MKKPEVKFDGLTVAVYFEKKQIISEEKTECGVTPSGRTRYKSKYKKEYINKAPEEFQNYIFNSGLIPPSLQKSSSIILEINGEVEKSYSIELVGNYLSPQTNPQYGYMYNIRSPLGCLITILCNPRNKVNSYNLVKFHGLLFSELSYNPMRYKQEELFNSLRQFVTNKENKASISKIDIALDFYHHIPYYELRTQMTAYPRAYCSGYTVKDSKKSYNLEPNLDYETSIYWGLHRRPDNDQESPATTGRSKALLYMKHKCPNQDICTLDKNSKIENAPKFIWYRLELRLRKTAAKNHGLKLLLSDKLTQDFAELLPKFLDFHEYKQPKIRQQWYQELINYTL